MLLKCVLLCPDLQSKPMVDLQSERNGSGQLVLTCVLFPQQELEETSRFFRKLVTCVLLTMTCPISHDCMDSISNCTFTVIHSLYNCNTAEI